jgi:hypothetical protein
VVRFLRLGFPVCALNVQYRMNGSFFELPHGCFYNCRFRDFTGRLNLRGRTWYSAQLLGPCSFVHVEGCETISFFNVSCYNWSQVRFTTALLLSSSCFYTRFQD